MINTEAELRAAIAWFREIDGKDDELVAFNRVVQYDGWWIRGKPLAYITVIHSKFAQDCGRHDFAVAPWVVAQIENKCSRPDNAPNPSYPETG